MFGLGGAQNGAGMTFASYWESLSIGFKCLIVATISLGILGTFTSVFELTLANILYYSIHRLQLWRLFTSFMVDSSIINVIFNLYLLNNLLPDLERRYSTAYLITEILLQTIYCNTALILFGEVFVMLGLASSKAFVSFGLTNLMFIFMWQKVAMNPQQMTRFCCFPCIMPLKYLPWCFLALLVLLGGGQTALIGCLLGYYQHIIRKKTLLPISQAVYIKMQKWLPHFIKGHSGFISISSVKANFNQISSGSSHSQRISSSQDTEEMSDQVSAGGAGVVIGGGSAQNADYRRHWMEQEDNADQSLPQESARPFKNEQSSSSVSQLKQKQTSQLI